jgi:uncharacterized protein YlbG (UPF0298 family)
MFSSYLLLYKNEQNVHTALLAFINYNTKKKMGPQNENRIQNRFKRKKLTNQSDHDTYLMNWPCLLLSL